MSSTDLIHMIGNIGLSFLQVQKLVSGFGYILGIVLLVSGIYKLTKIHKHSQERVAVPICFILGGAALIYLPTSIEVLSTTFFGTTNVLEYANYNPYDINSSMRGIVKTAGVIWFVRGSVLLIHASEPQEKHGMKGFLFLLAGIIAMNFEYTRAAVESALNYLMSLTV